MARGRERTAEAAGLQRLALLVLGLLLLALFIGVAITEGIGNPSIPSGDVAIVENVPEEVGAISQAEFDHAIEQQVAQAKLKKTPGPDSKKFEEMRTAALGELFDQIWIQGQAEELDISVPDKEVESELETIKKQSFGSKGSYKNFLRESEFTEEDVNDRVRLQLLSTQIQEKVNSEAPKPSGEDIQAYYDSVKDTQFTTAASRDVRVVVNEDKGKVEEAKVLLEKDNSPENWKKVVAKFSEDVATKSTGGLQRSLTRELLASQPDLENLVFDSAMEELAGPTDINGKFFVLEVDKRDPEKVQTFKEVSAQIGSQLEQQKQQEFFSEFITEYQSKWESRTFCADGFVVERCSNYRGNGHPEGASPGCYEADPKVPLAACPAAVAQSQPALPGSVSIVKPEGNQLPQQPRPVGIDSAIEEGTLPSP